MPRAQGLMGRDRQLTIAAVGAGPTPEEPEPLSFFDSVDSAQELRHRSTGLPLNPEMVKKARELEVQVMDELHVLEHSDRDAGMVETGRPPIRTDWVDIDNCTSCLCDHQWQGLTVAQSNVWTARCRSIVRQRGVRCDELDGSVPEQFQHLCCIQEGGVVTTSP